MGIHIDIQKNIDGFHMNVHMNTEAKRIGILGASGAGKSMTLRAIAGIEKIDSGKIYINGRKLYDKEEKISLKAQDRNVGYMFQKYALFPTMSVEENIGIALKCDKKEKAKLVAEILDKFQLKNLKHRLPHELSGGQQQRVALARLLIYKPEVILLDEPFSALDLHMRDEMQQEFMEMLSDYEGVVIMVSHSRDELYRFAEELYIMEEGKVIRAGNCKEVFTNPGTLSAAKLLGYKNYSVVESSQKEKIYLKDWNLWIPVQDHEISNIKYVGYSGRQWIPVWGEKEELCIKTKNIKVVEMPFEHHYQMLIENTGAKINWVLPQEAVSQIARNGFPDYLKIEKEHIMLLR